MTNPYYTRGDAITPFKLADARKVVSEFSSVQAGFDRVKGAIYDMTASAEALTGPSYASIEEGLADVASGKAFVVRNPDLTVSLYLNDNGVAVLQRTVTTTEALGNSEVGGTLVGIDDGAGGANFSTVAGFVARLLSSLGAGMVGWTGGLTGSVLRTIAAKAGDVISVRDFGAKGDGTANDTAAIQAAVNAMTASANGAHLYFPAGTYRITSAINIPFSTGWRIYGASRGNTTIRQDTNNTRIFHLTGDLSYGWEIADLTLGWLNTQPATNTSAIAIHMNNSAGTLFGYFNCVFRRLTINSGYRGICGTFTSQTPVWGARFVDCSFGGTMSGSSIYLVPSPAVGQPNILLENVYISTNPTAEPSVQISYCDNLVLKNVEWNGGSSTAAQNIPLFQFSQSNVTVLACRSEAYDFTTYAGGVIWAFTQCTFTLIGCAISAVKATGGSANGNIAVRGNVNSRGTLIGLQVNSLTTGWLTAYSIDEVTFVDKVTLAGNVTDNTLTYLGFRSAKKLDLSTQLADKTEFRGDADLTLTSAMGRLQVCNVALTANRVWILPSTGMLDGYTFDIVRNGGASPGAFTLQITDPLSGQNHVFASGANGSVRYRANGGSYTKIAATTFNTTS